MKAYRVAKEAVAKAEGPEQLALYEAITNSLDDFLTELAEHGLQNRAMWGIDPADIDIAAMQAECAQAWEQVKRLRAAGVTSRALIDPYVGSWMDPIGSRDWLSRMRMGVPHRNDPAWIARVTERIREEGG
jgi:hypothetical protein